VNALFEKLMRKMPQIITVVAIFFYVASVIITIADAEALRSLSDNFVPVTAKARAVILIFFQPMIPALLLGAAAAALWRFDRWWATRNPEVSE
jgi:hypothetical protein